MKLLRIVLLLLLSSALYGKKIEITSDSMKAQNLEKKVHFMGNVLIKESKNRLSGNDVIVYFNENNETEKYEATGSVKFEFIKEKIHYKGMADKVIYIPSKSEYLLSGHAVIDDIVNNRHVNGKDISLNMRSGKVDVKGSKKKPVKFIFDLEE